MLLEAQGSHGEHKRMQEPKNEDRCCEVLSSGHDEVAALCSYDALIKSKQRDQSALPQAAPTGLHRPPKQ